MARFVTGALLLVFALSLPLIVSAQVTTSGRLTGVVTDSLGALVPKADVKAIQNETKTSFTTTANSEGSWSIPSIPNGTYTITVSAANFKKTVIQNVKVDAGQVATANALLEPGGANEQIVITGGDVVTGHDPATGREVWRANGLNPRNDGSYRVVASPVVHADMIFAP